MTHLGLFEGIGGFSYAARLMGWETLAWCEWNPFCQTVLKHHFPNAHPHSDIKQTDFSIYRGKVDVLTGGWPCQDNSRAKQMGGPGKGLQGERSGLFYEFERAICEIQPPYVVCENVPDILTINQGLDFNYILSAMAKMGYNVTWGVLRAADIGAPHIRERLYMVAYSGSERLQTLQSIWQDARREIGNKKVCRLLDGTFVPIGGAWKDGSEFLRVGDGIPDRAHRLKALGNAIVPQIAEKIFRAIEEHENGMDRS